MKAHSITMLGTGLIGDCYTMTLHGQRSRDRVKVVYSRSDERGHAFRSSWDIPQHNTSMEDAIQHPDTSVVDRSAKSSHEEAITMAARAGKAVLCTRPLACTAEEAKRILEAPVTTMVLPENFIFSRLLPRPLLSSLPENESAAPSSRISFPNRKLQ